MPVLSYDYKTLDDDQAAAQAAMTSDYRKEYDPLFEVVKENAPDTGTAIGAEVIASGIVRSGEDRVEVLLFVNQPTTNKAADGAGHLRTRSGSRCSCRRRSLIDDVRRRRSRSRRPGSTGRRECASP